jgi:hypothetical protein
MNYREIKLRVYKDDDPFDIADNFCKINGIVKEELKERLAKTIIHFRNLYLQKQQKDKSNIGDIEDNNLLTSQDNIRNNINNRDDQ